MGTTEYDTQRIYDYILISVLLGNDFLPHMVSLNLRGTGMEELLQMYAEHVTKRREYLVSANKTILWKHVKYFIGKLALSEHTNIVDEYAQRAKLAKRKYPESTPEEREQVLQKTPTIYRGDEEYICPTEEEWEMRYYRVCFPESPPPNNAINSFELRSTEFPRTPQRSLWLRSGVLTNNIITYEGNPSTVIPRTPSALRPAFFTKNNNITDICINYLEGLEWVFRYYSDGCPHWRWKYRFHYPPLLADLYKHIPTTESSILGNIRAENRPVHPHIQLSYVLPPISQHLIPYKMQELIKRPEYVDLFVTTRNVRFSWLFCKYFWEAHVLLPEISVAVLEEWERTMRTMSRFR